MKKYSGLSIADYVIVAFIVSAIPLFVVYSSPASASRYPFLLNQGIIMLSIFAIIAFSISTFESYFENRSDIGPSSLEFKIWENIAYFIVILSILLVFWVSYYKLVDLIQTSLLALISVVITVAFQGTKKQAIERGAPPKGKRERKQSDVIDYSACAFSILLMDFLLYFWFIFGSLPNPSMFLMGFQVAGFLIIVTLYIYSCYIVNDSIPVAEKKTTVRRESVYGPPLWGKETVFGYPAIEKPSESDSFPYHRRPIPGVSKAISEVKSAAEEEVMMVWRSGEFIGNRMRYKIKIQNVSVYTITDITIYLIAYPNESLKLDSEDDDVHLSKMESKELLVSTFDFLPTQDCVRGEIKAGVTFVDMRGTVHTLSAKPFVIRSVCDLLLPCHITSHQFEASLKELECGEVSFKIEEWTPEEMFEKGLRIVDESNFFEVSSEIDTSEGVVYATISGYAHGKYTRKKVGVVLKISGKKGVKGASCTIRVSGEDEAMILPAIDDLKERLNAWLCPMCSSPLSITHVEDLKDGKVVECPFCNVTIGR